MSSSNIRRSGEGRREYLATWWQRLLNEHQRTKEDTQALEEFVEGAGFIFKFCGTVNPCSAFSFCGKVKAGCTKGEVGCER